ncbi:MAG: hypothetical protein J7L57_03785 [Deltaproteobacteria bacterium]|nr:hypothetical protein [Candidatus Tharpella sp.]
MSTSLQLLREHSAAVSKNQLTILVPVLLQWEISSKAEIKLQGANVNGLEGCPRIV